ncbi:uncharacterized protein FSUBG_2448 [Fusarium subglutinans]|uniref:Uncharacterized protein n=1 Tax=Gibberella subglutinans TaxID=42677 RepID=A0A8H5Q9K6_GIBSU|nr:uncharacterized protein FSUBG_2448 [Fusarium subglutinans]KAF5611169.1 hypothetical protein FSUBG_2448 [Fusarium subglutinans]
MPEGGPPSTPSKRAIPAMMNGSYMDIISIFKAISGMLEQGADRFKDAHKLGIFKATVPDSTESNSTKSNSTTLVQLGQRFRVLVNTDALTHNDIDMIYFYTLLLSIFSWAIT